MLKYSATLESAMQYGKEEKMDVWLHLYLNEEGRNIPFSDGLKLCKRYFFSPAQFPIILFKRCAGPEEDMKYRVDKDWWEYKISELAKVIQSGKVMPPLIVQYIDGEFELNDGNHRHKVYEGLGIEKNWVIIWITEEKELKDFMCQYHNLFLRMALGNIGYITTILAFNDNCLYVPQTPEEGKLLTLLYVE